MKKNLIKIFFFTGLVLISITSCKKNNVVLDQAPLIPLEAARFLMVPTVSNNYYNFDILKTPSPGTVYNLPVGVTTVSNVDRKVSFTITSRTAAAGVQYTAPAELIIKAGKALDTLKIQGLFAGYPSGRKDTLKIKITSGAGFIDKNAYQDSVMLVMKKACPLDMAEFAGNFVVLQDAWADYGAGDVIPLTVSGDTVMFKYFANDAVPIKILVNKTNNTTSVAKQVYGRYGATEVFSCASVAGSSSNFIDPCDRIISVNLNHTSPLGNYGNFVIRLQKQ